MRVSGTHLPPHRWLRKLIAFRDPMTGDLPPHRWLRNIF
ncbi:hypothetical protein [uncultured Gammaproteobacteria bacterium]|nr:hypothetical protein [uncultured Gammaproteobacteria bacterium]